MKTRIAALTLLLAACSGGGDEDGNAAADANAAGGAEDKAEAVGEAEAGTGTSKGANGANRVAFQPGQWEMRTEMVRMEIPGMPAGAMPPGAAQPTTVRHCLTPEQAARPTADFFSPGQEVEGCSQENLEIANGRVRSTIQCERGESRMRLALDGRFTATSYEISQRMTASEGGQNITIEGRTTARRVGDCPEG